MTVRTVEPTTYDTFITKDELEEHLRLVADVESTTYLSALVKAAVDVTEHHCNRAILVGTYKLTLDYWPYVIQLAKPPLNGSVTSVQYYDTSNNLQTVDSSNYIVTTDNITEIHPINGYSWPTTYTRKGAVIVNYDAGQDAADVPKAIKQACLIMAGEMYNARYMSGDKEMFYSKAYQNLLAPYVIREV